VADENGGGVHLENQGWLVTQLKTEDAFVTSLKPTKDREDQQINETSSTNTTQQDFSLNTIIDHPSKSKREVSTETHPTSRQEAL